MFLLSNIFFFYIRRRGTGRNITLSWPSWVEGKIKISLPPFSYLLPTCIFLPSFPYIYIFFCSTYPAFVFLYSSSCPDPPDFIILCSFSCPDHPAFISMTSSFHPDRFALFLYAFSCPHDLVLLFILMDLTSCLSIFMVLLSVSLLHLPILLLLPSSSCLWFLVSLSYIHLIALIFMLHHPTPIFLHSLSFSLTPTFPFF